MGQTSPWDIAADASGNSYISGGFAGTVDFDPLATHADNSDVLTARGISDAFIAKYAPDDSLLWALRMGGDSEVGEGGGSIDSANRSRLTQVAMSMWSAILVLKRLTSVRRRSLLLVRVMASL